MTSAVGGGRDCSATGVGCWAPECGAHRPVPPPCAQTTFSAATSSAATRRRSRRTASCTTRRSSGTLTTATWTSSSTHRRRQSTETCAHLRASRKPRSPCSAQAAQSYRRPTGSPVPAGAGEAAHGLPLQVTLSVPGPGFLQEQAQGCAATTPRAARLRTAMAEAPP